MNRCTSLRIAPWLGLALASVSCGSSGGGSSPPLTGECATLANYTATPSAPAYSFATDILPIVSNPSTCGTAGACHGNPAGFVNTQATIKLQSFTGTAAAVLAALETPSVNDPAIDLVKPGDVGASMLAYKLSGTAALACSNLNCKVGTTLYSTSMTPCGDPMPVAGYVPAPSASDITKVLDWIAQGAKP
jgi:hypothetical protein